jgi:hypothetical protein
VTQQYSEQLLVHGTPALTWVMPTFNRSGFSYTSPWDLPDVMAAAREAVVLEQRQQQSSLVWLLGGEVAALFSG